MRLARDRTEASSRVLADLLREQGDPHAELITLQLAMDTALEEGHDTAPLFARTLELLDAHPHLVGPSAEAPERAELNPTSRALMTWSLPKTVRWWRRGFVHALAMHQVPSSMDWEALWIHPSLGTLRCVLLAGLDAEALRCALGSMPPTLRASLQSVLLTRCTVDASVGPVLAQLISLRRLYMDNHARTSEPLSVVPALSSLRHLHDLRLEAGHLISGAHIGSADPGSLGDLWQLRSIEASLGSRARGTTVSQDRARAFVDALPATIEELTLSGFERVGDPLHQALDRLEQLRFVELTPQHGPGLRSHGMVGLDFRDWRQQGEQIPHRRAGGLSFLSIDVDDTNIAALAEQPLRALRIRNAPRFAGESLRLLSGLRWLHLERCDAVTNEALRGMSLQTLILDRCAQLTPAGILLLRPTLEVLRIALDRFDDASLVSILEHHRSLEELWVGRGLTSQAARQLLTHDQPRRIGSVRGLPEKLVHRLTTAGWQILYGVPRPDGASAFDVTPAKSRPFHWLED